MVSAGAIPAHDMLGMKLDYIDWSQSKARMIETALSGASAYCCVPNVYQSILCHDDVAFRAVVNGADFTMTDSMILQKARSWRYGVGIPETVRGAEMLVDLCRDAERDNVPVAFVGGKDDDVLNALTTELLKLFPGLKVAYAIAPPFRALSDEEDRKVTADINASGAKLVFVGLGCPKQERWMAAHKGRVNAMMIGVGAAFDFVSGTVKPSPAWVHKNGLEWLYRLMSEPRRLWKRYISTSPRFIVLIVLHKLSGK